MPPETKSFYFKGIKISNNDSDGILNLIETIINEKRKAYLCMTDVGNLMMALKDPKLRSAINQADLSIADGTPLSWFGKLTGHKKVERISGVTLFEHLIDKTNYSHFILGDTTETQNKLIVKAKDRKPDLHINGYSPPFKPQFSEVDNREIVKNIKNINPDIIWVSFGGSKQEKWMHQNVSKLNNGIMIGVGAAFKYYIGDLKIPHEVIQKIGLQWITRFKNNPKRWMTKGQFRFRILFSLYFPFEMIRAKHRNRRLFK
jgi:N-acetylglucosaminyldiphosphoundecaprenol N-acetyl-beta-D-mannosaminyltransferase